MFCFVFCSIVLLADLLQLHVSHSRAVGCVRRAFQYSYGIESVADRVEEGWREDHVDKIARCWRGRRRINAEIEGDKMTSRLSQFDRSEILGLERGGMTSEGGGKERGFKDIGRSAPIWSNVDIECLVCHHNAKQVSNGYEQARTRGSLS